MMSIFRRTHSPVETEHLAQTVGASIVAGDIIALHGELGAGKTCFVRGLTRGMGLDPRHVSSPTYIILQEYSAGEPPSLVHVDAYRLSGPADLESIGWSELLEREDVVIAVEWPGVIEGQIPAWRRIDVWLEHAGEGQRRIRMSIPRHKAERFRALQRAQTACPMCERVVSIDEPHFPFCSERCRLADLHDWFTEKHRISRAAESEPESGDAETQSQERPG